MPILVILTINFRPQIIIIVWEIDFPKFYSDIDLNRVAREIACIYPLQLLRHLNLKLEVSKPMLLLIMLDL